MSIKKLVFLTLIAGVSLGLWRVYGNQDRLVNRTEAAGDVVITYNGIPLSGAIFSSEAMLPGDCMQRVVTLLNEGSSDIDLGVYPVVHENEASMSGVITMKVEGVSKVFEGTMEELSIFTTENVLMLEKLEPNISKNVTFSMCMKPETGNDYQGRKLRFDLVFAQQASGMPLPLECASLQGTIKKIITGTEGNDRLRGGLESELILGLGGNDNITGGLGHDCIVGSDGEDVINAGVGNDMVLGGDGADKIDGGVGIDKVWGGAGDDQIDGGVGGDRLMGEEGNDKLRGGIDADYLDGGADIDWGDGQLGKDTCIGLETKKSCEL